MGFDPESLMFDANADVLKMNTITWCDKTNYSHQRQRYYVWTRLYDSYAFPVFSLCNIYRPQTKFAKVMFLQVSVCPQGGGVRVTWHTPPPATMHAPPAATHAPPRNHAPPRQPRTPPSSHARPPRSHACPPPPMLEIYTFTAETHFLHLFFIFI